MKNYRLKFLFKLRAILIIMISVISLNSNLLRSQESYLEDLEIDSSTKLENDNILPTNPFEIVEMIRRANSMNDATKPSDAIDDALKSFDMIKKNK